MFSIFQRKNQKKIEILENTICELKNEIEIKNREIAKLNKDISMGNMNVKQIELIDKNIRELREENIRLKKILGYYGIGRKKENYFYKIDLDKFYSSAKFKEILGEIQSQGIKYLQDLEEETFNKIDENLKGYQEAREKFLKYRDANLLEWELITLLNKGEKITKIYSKNRKFCNIVSEKNIEFMDDMLEFDFDILKDGFDVEMIEELKEKRDNYYQEKRYKI